MRNALLLGLMLAAGTAQAFELKKDREGDVVRWSGGVTFVIDPKLDGKLSAPGATEAVKAAISTWSNAMPNVEISATVGDVEQASSTITVIEKDWPYDDGVMAVTILKVDYANDRIVEADIVFNGAQHRFKVLPADSKRGGAFADVQNTVTHELGHAIGLQHDTDLEEAVMYPMAYNGEVNKRALSSDEIAGLDALYPLTELAPQVGCSASGSAVPAALAAALMLALARRRQPRVLSPKRIG